MGESAIVDQAERQAKILDRDRRQIIQGLNPTRGDLPIVANVAPGLADCGHDLALLANFQAVRAEPAADHQHQDHQPPNAQANDVDGPRVGDHWTVIRAPSPDLRRKR